MKVKLLKKIRKQYSITYYEKQISLWDKTYYGETMVLRDNSENHYPMFVEINIIDKYKNNFSIRANTKEEAKKLLLKNLADWIATDYRRYRTRKPKQQIETIWYNPKQ